ncbi:MAG: GNAT family N-acetyltransferase [Gemmatimonadota bacterium]
MSAPRVRLSGPEPIAVDEIPALNLVFSDAFSERYRRDGMTGVRVPPLNPVLWRFAIEAAGAGAMCWRDAQGRIAAFNLAHVSGSEGWMGPLVVREDLQGQGVGREIVTAGIGRLLDAGCRTVGLETMPRTMDNIGFYARLGFVPAHLTITVALDAGSPAGPRPERLSAHQGVLRARAMTEIAACTDQVRPGADYAREIEGTLHHGVGDCVIVRDPDGAVSGFALVHEVPLVEGRVLEELRVLKLVVREVEALPGLIERLGVAARQAGASRVAVRLQGAYPDLLRQYVATGARVRWTDLRMTLAGYGEPIPTRGVVLSNWEL